MARSSLLVAMLAFGLGGASPALADPSGSSAGLLEASPLASHTQGVGVQVSWLSGSGLTYRRWLDNGFGFQVSGVPFLTSGSSFINVGGQVMKEFFRSRTVRGYGLLGAGLAYSYGGTSYDNNGAQVAAPTSLNVGIPLGIGGEWFVTDNLAFTAGAGYTLAFPLSFSPGGTIGLMLEW